MKSITKRIISTLFICGALVLEAGAVAFGSLGKKAIETKAATTNTVVFTVKGWAGSSNSGYIATVTAGTGTVTGSTDTIGASMIQHNPSNGQVRGNQTSVANNWSMYNSDPIPGSITKIAIAGSGTWQNNLYCAVGTSSVSSQTDTSKGTDWSSTRDWSFNSSSNYKYFKLYSNKKFTSGNVTGVSVTVTYEVASADPEKLATPSPSYNDMNKTVSWSAVTGASSYQVKVDSGSYATATSPFDVSGLTTGSSHTVSVKAIGDGENYTDSDAGSCTFTPTAPKELSSIAVTSSSHRVFDYGATFVKETITATYSDLSTADVTDLASFSGYDMNQSGAQTVSVSYGGKSTSYSITVGEKPAVKEYTLVTDTSDLSDGDEILFACNTKGAVAGAFSSKYLSSVTGTFSEDKTTVTSESGVPFVANKSETNWTFTSSDGVLGTSGAKTMVMNSGTKTWTVSISNGTASVTSTGSGYGSIKYNSSDPRFLNYASGQTDIQIYKVGSSEPKLSAPTNLKYEDGVLSWTGVANATGYKVSVDEGAATTVTTTSYTVALPQLASVSVVATDSTSTYKDSSAATYLNKNRGSSTNPLSVSDAVTLIEYETGKVNEKYTEEKIYVTGVTTADSTYNSKYSNYDKVTISDDKNTLTIQRATRNDDKTDTIKAGSTVVGYGYGEYYNGCTLYPKNSDNPVLTSVIGQTYTVSYKPGAYGTGSEQSDVKEDGVALTLKGAIFTRTGYSQAGWATEDGGAKVYELSDSYTADEAATLYPYWDPDTYTVYYDKGQYGTGENQTDTKIYDVDLKLKASIFTRTGYTQTGWATEDGGARVYDPGAKYTENKSITLYPVWMVQKFTVMYKPGEGVTGEEYIGSKQYGVPLTLRGETYYKEGHTQTGWATEDGGEKVYDLEGTYTNNTASFFFPFWTADTYTVTYAPGAYGAEEQSTATKTYGVDLKLPGAIFTRSGYKQTGWALTDGGEKAYDLEGTYSANAGTTLYPVWAEIPKHSVTYLANGATGDVPTQENVAEGSTFTIADATSLTKQDYHFVGWNDGTSTYQPEETYTMGTGNVTLTAQWELDTVKYSVGYSLTGVTVPGDAPTEVEEGNDLVVAITPNQHYKIETMGVTMGGETAEYTYENGVLTVENVTGNIVVSVSAAEKWYGATTQSSQNVTFGSIDPHLYYNEPLDVDVTANTGCHIVDEFSSVAMQGESGYEDIPGAYSNGHIHVDHVTGNLIIQIIAEKDTFSVSATLNDSVVAEGSELPETVEYGDNLNVTFEPKTGYQINSITYKVGDAAEQTVTGSTLSIENITANVSLTVNTSKIVCSVTATYGDSTNSNTTTSIEYGDSYSGKITPNDGKKFTSISMTMGGNPVTVADDGTYNIASVTGNIVINVVTTDITYAVSATGSHYTNNNSATSVLWHGAYEATITPDDGYFIEDLDVTMGGESATVSIAEHGTSASISIASVTGDISIAVTSTEIEMTSIASAVTKEADYEFGYDFDESDVAVVANFNDGTTGSVDATSVEGYDITKSGSQTVTVKVGEFEKKITVEIRQSTVIDSIEASTEKTEVAYDGTFTAADVSVTYVYTDGHTLTGQAAESISGFDAKTVGPQTVTVNAAGKETTITVTVLPSTVIDSITASTEKTEVAYDGTFTAADVSVTYVYTDGHTLTGQAAESISGFGAKTIGPQTVTVNAAGKETTITVTVLPSTVVESIAASTEKTEVEYGGTFTKDDVSVVATYTDGHTGSIDCESISGFDGNVVGAQTVTVNAGGKETTITVTVKASEVIDHIEVSTDKTVVDYGGTFTKEDVKVTYVYTDGHKVENQVAESISGFDSLKIGEQIITVSAAGKTATLTITVNGHVVTSLDVTGYDEYVDQGKEYVFNGKVVAHYADETSEEVTGYTVSKVNTEEHGPQKATVSFGGVSVTITVNVIQTKTPVEPYAAVAIGGGAVVGVTIIAAGLFFFLKKFKI